ncbi:MAG: DUF1189 family protein [Legionellales bacterium]|nr:DUF1189 family protein [Legionellales bacterium]
MKKFSLLQAIIYSFFSRALYSQVGQKWIGAGFKYLFLLIMLYSLPLTLKWQLEINYFAKFIFPPILKELPLIKIDQGSLSIDKAVPYTIYHPLTHLPYIIFDTASASLVKPSDAKFVVHAHQLSLRWDNLVHEYRFDTQQSATLTPEFFAMKMRELKTWFSFIAYPLTVILGFSTYLFAVIILALLGLIFVSLTDRQLDYIALLRLSVVALTPALLLHAIIKLLDIHFSHQLFVGVIITLCYLFFAILANPKRAPIAANDEVIS